MGLIHRLLLGQLILVLVLVRALILVVLLLMVLLTLVVREVQIGTPPRAKIEVEGHAGQEKGGSPGGLVAKR